MAVIFILGDSWGTRDGLPPHYRKDNPHLEQHLESAGHVVHNYSRCAGRNSESMDRALKHLDLRPDYIIWFHTESLRDFMPKQRFRIWESTVEHARANYLQFKKLLDANHAKDIIIGGQAPVLRDLLVHDPYYIIEDWRCELLNIPSIVTHSVCHTYLFKHKKCDDSKEERLRMLEQNEVIIDAEKKHPWFPDNCHPGAEAHLALFERISKLLC